MKPKIIKKRNMWVKEVAAPSIEEALGRLDDMGKSCYDMYLVEIGPYEEMDFYTRIRVIGWENDETRETLEV